MRRDEVLVPERFRPVPDSEKVECVLCGRRGYDGAPRGYGWQKTCSRDHAPCPGGCGRVFPVLLDGTPRRHPHARHDCPGPS